MTDTESYAICLDCDIEHEDRAAMTQHSKDTMAPTGEKGIVARGHRSRVVNPTPEEVIQNNARHVVNRAIEDITYALFEDLDRSIRHGDATLDAVTQELRYTDFAEGWADWLAEGEN